MNIRYIYNGENETIIRLTEKKGVPSETTIMSIEDLCEALNAQEMIIRALKDSLGVLVSTSDNKEKDKVITQFKKEIEEQDKYIFELQKEILNQNAKVHELEKKLSGLE